MLFLIVVIALVIILLNYKSSLLPYSYSVIFAGSDINNACNDIGQQQTIFSQSNTVGETARMYTDSTGRTPISNGQYNYEGARMVISGGNGEVEGIVGCA